LRFVEAFRIRDKSITEGPFVVRRNDIIYRLTGDEYNEADADAGDAGD
jgi:hypothetical protein